MKWPFGTGRQEPDPLLPLPLPRPAAPQPSFDVRPLGPPVTPVPPAYPVAPPAAGDGVGIRFTAPARAFDFLAVFGVEGGPAYHRDPRDGAAWAFTDNPAEAVLELARALGGEVVHGIPDGARGWPLIAPAELAAGLATTATPAVPAEADVVTGGTLAAAFVRHCLAAEIPVTLTAVDLSTAGHERAAVLLHLGGPGATRLPAPLLRLLAGQPGTTVCRAPHPDLLVDYRSVLERPAAELAVAIPPGERWLIADGVTWVVTERGRATTPSLVLDTPPAPPPESDVLDPVRLDAALRVNVELVPCGTGTGEVHATLIDHADLGALCGYLAFGPHDDALHLVPGAGRSLLVEPGGLSRPVPFGVGLTRLGSDGLYVEAGCRLRPTPPRTALVRHYGLAEDTVVAVTREGVFRFSTDRPLPAWTLWLGKPPEVHAGLDERGRTLLRRLDEAMPDRVARTDPAHAPETGAPAEDPGARAGLLRAAERLEHAGKLSAAAAKLEQAGEFYRAGRIYERVARERP